MQYAMLSRQFTDVLTKPLSKSKCFRDKFSVVENASLAERQC